MTSYIPSIYKPLFGHDYQYYVFYGGRGGGKTENVAQSLVLLSATQKLRILCIRESQSSLAESVKSVIEKWIDALNLNDQFKITTSSITSKSGSDFIFMGMRSHTAVNVKSITGINITWIEEAEAFSKRSWQLLVPSVIRTPNPKIIITFNPYKDDDIIYQEFIANRPPAKSYIRNVNYDNNPFFKGSHLEAQMLDDKERLPPSEFNHTWLGKLVTFSEDSLFKDADLSVLQNPSGEYTKMIIACDPAATDKDFSNEFGIIVLGKTRTGLIEILDDLSGNMSPIEFANTVIRAKSMYSCNNVCIEVNNGGDFIKAVLIQVDPTLNIIEVRAVHDKVQRALPVANLMSIGKVRLAKSLPKLTRQMRLLTSKGFTGSRGESPDRLDACVWGVYELAEIKDKDSIYTVFKPEWIEESLEYVSNSYLSIKNILYIRPIDNVIVCISFNVRQVHTDIRLEILDSMIIDSIYEISEDFNNYQRVYCADIASSNTILKALPNVLLYEPLKITKSNLDDTVRNMLPVIKNNKVYIPNSAKTRSYNNTTSMLLKTDLMEFKYSSDRDFLLVKAFCDIIYQEFSLKRLEE